VYFDRESQPLGIYTGRKIRQYLPDFGVTCFGESVIEPKVLELTIEFLQKIKFKGLGTAEFAKDRIGGEYLFLELNGRSYYHNILFTDCGINLPYINYCDLTGQPLHHYSELRQIEGIKWLDFNRDSASFLRKYKNRRIGFGEWIHSIVQARSFAYFKRNDLLPFFFGMLILLSILSGKLREMFRYPRPKESSPTG
jgi:predicted ATP-grasp superfamily ATP-dependent carboligase